MIYISCYMSHSRIQAPADLSHLLRISSPNPKPTPPAVPTHGCGVYRTRVASCLSPSNPYPKAARGDRAPIAQGGWGERERYLLASLLGMGWSGQPKPY